METCPVYKDYVLINSNTVEDHTKHAYDIHTAIYAAGIMLKLKKCAFFLLVIASSLENLKLIVQIKNHAVKLHHQQQIPNSFSPYDFVTFIFVSFKTLSKSPIH